MKTKIKDKGTVPFRIFKAILGPIFNLYYNIIINLKKKNHQ